MQNVTKLVIKVAVPSMVALQACSNAAAQQVSLASTLRLPRESVYVLQKADLGESQEYESTAQDAEEDATKKTDQDKNTGTRKQAEANSSGKSQATIPSPIDSVIQSPVSGLGLIELEQLACQYNPTILRYSALVASARGLAYQAGRMPNPTVGYQGQQIGSKGQAEQHGAIFNQDFIRREKRQLDRSVATQDIAQAEQRLAAQQQRVLTDVRSAYYRVLYVQQQIVALEELKGIAQKAVDIAKQLLAAEEVAKTDLLQAEVEKQQAELQLANAQYTLQATWSQLSAVVGQPMQLQPLAGDFFAPTEAFEFEQTLAWFCAQSPDVLAANARIYQARCYLQRQIVEPRPNMSVQGLYNFVDNGIGGKPDAGIAVAVPLPLWNKNEGNIASARQELVAAEQMLAQVQLRIKQDLALVMEQYNRANSQANYLQEQILPRVQQTLDLTRQTYEAGEVNFVALLTVQRTYAQNKLAYLDALATVRKAEIDLRGMLLNGSLNTQ
jgi:outer membrane protein, heavy metal efflux system